MHHNTNTVFILIFKGFNFCKSMKVATTHESIRIPSKQKSELMYLIEIS